MHSARIHKSKRLQCLLGILSDGSEHSTAAIEDIARGKGMRLCAVHSIASELRDRGIAVNCQRRGNVWFYRLGR